MSSIYNNIPLPTIRRMPGYLRVLQDFQKEQEEWITTTNFSSHLSLKPIQIRKDMVYTGITGTPRLGFEVDKLTQAIRKMLGWDNPSEAVLIGAGALGSALLGYKGFAAHGLKIVAPFDSNDSIVGNNIHGLVVQPMEKLEDLIVRMGISIGIITVPDDSGQSIADRLIAAGIQGIWNFSSVKLKVPSYIMVQKEDIASGLAVLSVKMKNEILP